jgi:hypothetical protein
MRSNRKAWSIPSLPIASSSIGHVIRRDESHITQRVMSMKIGHPSRGRLKKRWIDCVTRE